MTGGTIGSSEHNGIISTCRSGCTAIDKYNSKYGSSTDFHIFRILNILSENLTLSHWETIVNHLLTTDLSGYNGVLILHGSDTLSYSSAFLGIALSSIKIPVVITASDRVPDDPESNACENIRAAVLCFKSLSRGVFSVYKNKDNSFCSVYLATRLNEADRVFGNFSSFDGVPFAIVENDTIKLRGGIPAEKVISCSGYRPSLPLVLKNRVLMIRQYPGARLTDIVLSDDTKAVLVITYHSSSASTEEDGSVLGLLKRCKEKNIELFLASFDKNGSAVYETSSLLIKNGARPLKHISNEAAYAKLLLWAQLPESEREIFLNENCFFEYL